jgi:hypothetical protein
MRIIHGRTAVIAFCAKSVIKAAVNRSIKGSCVTHDRETRGAQRCR